MTKAELIEAISRLPDDATFSFDGFVDKMLSGVENGFRQYRPGRYTTYTIVVDNYPSSSSSLTQGMATKE